jgi:hypothetical protein
MRESFEQSFYSSINTTEVDEWDDLVDMIESYVVMLRGIPWKPSGNTSLSVGIDHVKDKKDGLEAIREIVEIASDITYGTNDLVFDDLEELNTEITKEISDCPDDFESSWDTEKKKRHDTHTTQKRSERKTTFTW